MQIDREDGRPAIWIDPSTGKRYRIVSVPEYLEKPNLPVTRQELAEVLQLTVHNLRCRTLHGRLLRLLAIVLRFEGMYGRWTPKGSVKLLLGER